MNYSILSKHRTKIMALAMFWIAFFHATCWFDNKAISFFKTNGFGGVDMFLFLFSLGLFYSLKRNTELSLFYIHRAKRILPYVVPVFVFVCVLNQYDFTKSLLFLHFLDFWRNNNTVLWYVAALPAFVLIAPFYMKLVEKNEKLSILVAIWISVLAFVYFKERTQMIFASRLPVYFVGFHFGKMSYDKKKISIAQFVILMILLMVGLYFLYYNYHHFGSKMWSHGLYWYPFVMMTGGICVLSASVFELLEKIKPIQVLTNGFAKLGTITLEFYLFHEMIIKFVDAYVTWLWDTNNIMKNVLSFVLTIIAATLYHFLIHRIISGIKNHFSNNHSR